jgi:hypothetical protein
VTPTTHLGFRGSQIADRTQRSRQPRQGHHNAMTASIARSCSVEGRAARSGGSPSPPRSPTAWPTTPQPAAPSAPPIPCCSTRRASAHQPPLRPPLETPRRTPNVGRRTRHLHPLAPPHHPHLGRTTPRLRHRPSLRRTHRQRLTLHNPASTKPGQRQGVRATGGSSLRLRRRPRLRGPHRQHRTSHHHLHQSSSSRSCCAVDACPPS